MCFIWFPFAVGTIWPAINGSETVDTVFISGSIFASMNYCDYLHFHFSVRFYKIRENGKKNSIPAAQTKVAGEKSGFLAGRHEYNGFIWFHKVQQWWVWMNDKDKHSLSPLLLTYMKGKAPERLGPFWLRCVYRVPPFPSPEFQHFLQSLTFTSVQRLWHSTDIQLCPWPRFS